MRGVRNCLSNIHTEAERWIGLALDRGIAEEGLD